MKDLTAGERLGRKFTFSPFIPNGQGLKIHVLRLRLLYHNLQRIRSTVDEKEQKQLLMDLDVVMRSNDCPYIVQFYGALFKEVRN